MNIGRRRRTFAALIDQDGVALVEYGRESGGFRVLGSRFETRRFEAIESAADAIVGMLAAAGASHGGGTSLAVAIQHFGACFHTMVLPPSTDDVIRPIVEREVQRLFQLTDPVIAFTRGEVMERRDRPRTDDAKPSRQVLVAGLPRATLSALQSRLAAVRVWVEIVTVVPAALRRVYEAVEGSPEPTAMLVCLASGPHVAFFVDGRLELAIEPPIALDGERMLDPLVIADQVERGGVFLRQQTRGVTATRILLAAEPSDYDGIASILDSRTRLVVQPLARSVGSPEAIIALGAVLEAASSPPLDLLTHPPTIRDRVRAAVRGPSSIATGFATAAAVASLWAVMGFATFSRTRAEIATANDSIARAASSIEPLRGPAQRRASVAEARSVLDAAAAERRDLLHALEQLSAGSPPGVEFDSMAVRRTADGWRISVRLHATGATGGEAIRSLNTLFGYLKTRPEFRGVTLGDSLVWLSRTKDSASTVSGDTPPGQGFRLVVSLGFVALAGAR